MTTISKVAERAGVSRTTVSHVLNHADRVSVALRERVMQAVAELGYVPNPHARSLRTGKTDMVALLIPDIANPFYPDLVLTAQAALEAAGLDTMIFNSDVPGGHPQEHSREYLRRIRALRVDGLIATDFSLHGMHEALLQVDVPAVFIGRLPNRAVDNVRADDFGGGYLMGRYLAGRGHRRVAHVTGPSFFGEAMQRAEGFERGLAEHGLPPDPALRFEGTYLSPSGLAAIDWLFERHAGHLPSAIFFANYLMAIGGLAGLRDRGLSVPGDVAVGVFGDVSAMEFVRPRLTRVGVSPARLARRAAEMLVERLTNAYQAGPRYEILESALVVSDSA